jgi:hypothetical protein
VSRHARNQKEPSWQNVVGGAGMSIGGLSKGDGASGEGVGGPGTNIGGLDKSDGGSGGGVGGPSEGCGGLGEGVRDAGEGVRGSGEGRGPGVSPRSPVITKSCALGNFGSRT